MTALGSVAAGHDTDTLADCRQREQAAVGLLVEHLARIEAARLGHDNWDRLGEFARGRQEQHNIRRRVLAEVTAHVTAPDTDELVSYCREVARGEHQG